MIDFSSIKRILVAKLRHHGDVLLSGPVFSNLKRICPQAKIDAYIYKETLPMLEGHPDIDGFILYDRKDKRKYHSQFKMLRQIRGKGYDLILNLTEGDRGAIAAMVSGARYRVAFDPKGQGMWGKARCYTHLVKECPMMRHTVEMNLDLLRGIGIFPGPEDKSLYFHIPDQARAVVPSGEYAVVHPVSRWMFKCAPEKVIAESIDYLLKKGQKVVLTGSNAAEEVSYNERVKELVKGDIIDMTGKISLKELGALIDDAKLLLCVDSVPMHMSSALKTPVVAIFGPTSEKRWAPWQNPEAQIVAQNYTCRPCYRPGCSDSGKSDCLMTLDSAQIITAIDHCVMFSAKL